MVGELEIGDEKDQRERKAKRKSKTSVTREEMQLAKRAEKTLEGNGVVI